MSKNIVSENDFREEELFKRFLEKQTTGESLFADDKIDEPQITIDDLCSREYTDDGDRQINSFSDVLPSAFEDKACYNGLWGKIKYYFNYITDVENARCLSVLLIPGFLIIMFLINFLSPTNAVSEKENRTLAQFPEISAKALTDGTFTKGFEDYIADQFVFRNSFVSAKRGFEVMLGKKENHGILFADDGYLIENAADLGFENVKSNVKGIEDLASVERYNVVVAVVPTAYEVMSNKLPSNAYTNVYGKLYDNIKSNIKSPAIKLIDVSPVLKQNNSEYLYYRTDHHQTALGSYYLYQALSNVLSYNPYPLSDFKAETVAHDFMGTTWSNSGFAPTKADQISKYTYKEEYTSEVTFGAEDKKLTSLYSDEMLKTKDKYAYYLDGNHGITEVKTSCPTNASIAIIKDSYAHSLVPFLANHYSRIYMIDLRYYNGDIFEYLYTSNVKDVLVLYNQNTFMTDNNLKKISAMVSTSPYSSVPKVNYGIIPKQEAVDISYFDDAVFVGDSLTLGISYHSGFNSDFLCAGGLSIRNIETEIVKDGKNTIKTLQAMDNVGKVYIMLGTNDAVFQDKEEYLSGYSAFIDDVRDRFPNAVIYIQSIMPVTKTFSNTHDLKNNMLTTYNEYLVDLAIEKQCYYIDLNSYFADSDGYLPNDAGGDGVHLSPENYKKLAEYLMNHAVDVGGVKKIGSGIAQIFKGGDYNTAKIGEELLKNVKFKDTMSKVGDALAVSNYNLDTSYVLSASLYVSGGSTAEEVAVFEVSSADKVKDVVALIEDRIKNKKKDFETYMPAEMTKLNNPYIITKGKVVVLCLADSANVETIKSLIK